MVCLNKIQIRSIMLLLANGIMAYWKKYYKKLGFVVKGIKGQTER